MFSGEFEKTIGHVSNDYLTQIYFTLKFKYLVEHLTIEQKENIKIFLKYPSYTIHIWVKYRHTSSSNVGSNNMSSIKCKLSLSAYIKLIEVLVGVCLIS